MDASGADRQSGSRDEARDPDELRAIAEDAPQELDLTSAAHLDAVRSLAEALESKGSAAALLDVEARALSDPSLPVSVRVALKLARSRLLLRDLERPVHVSVVFAVYKEHHRILTVEEHPAGEDFLRRKLEQLRWLFAVAPHHTWDLTVVDDGCPEGSGRLAQAVFEQFSAPGEEVQVLFLEDAIREGLPIVGDMRSTSESQKGGAIRFGLWNAVRQQRDAYHIALFTDADLSTHLGQIGLLARPMVDGGSTAAVGSRREPSSVVVKVGTRNVRGKLFIYLWKRLIPQLKGIIDTQCGFKAFDARYLATWIEETRDNGFSFDVEFLLRVQLGRPGSIEKVPVAWIDSEAASTTADLEPYLPMLKSIAGLYRNELPDSTESDSFAELIERLDAETFNTLVNNVPPDIANREPIEFDDFHGVTAMDLARAADVD